LLIRRNWATGELAFDRCYSQHPVTLAALVTVAGLRWTVAPGDASHHLRWSYWRRRHQYRSRACH